MFPDFLTIIFLLYFFGSSIKQQVIGTLPIKKMKKIFTKEKTYCSGFDLAESLFYKIDIRIKKSILRLFQLYFKSKNPIFINLVRRVKTITLIN